jgi:carbon storage regulator
MLVLSRRVGESIIVDSQIRITVTGIRGGKVRMGIDAPPSVRVDRSEIHERRTQRPTEVPLEHSALEDG